MVWGPTVSFWLSFFHLWNGITASRKILTVRVLFLSSEAGPTSHRLNQHKRSGHYCEVKTSHQSQSDLVESAVVPRFCRGQLCRDVCLSDGWVEVEGCVCVWFTQYHVKLRSNSGQTLGISNARLSSSQIRGSTAFNTPAIHKKHLAVNLTSSMLVACNLRKIRQYIVIPRDSIATCSRDSGRGSGVLLCFSQPQKTHHISMFEFLWLKCTSNRFREKINTETKSPKSPPKQRLMRPRSELLSDSQRNSSKTFDSKALQMLFEGYLYRLFLSTFSALLQYSNFLKIQQI